MPLAQGFPKVRFTDPLGVRSILRSQVRIFEEMRTTHNNPLRQNYRELQSINGRRVYLKVSPIREHIY
ncbi:hypothetical protein NQ317_004799, partial [Molorchus minor]